MNWKLTAGITLVMVGILVAGILVLNRNRTRPGITVTLRVAVSPGERADFVAGQANSARFSTWSASRLG